MTKFECGKWYRIRKPENLQAPAPSFLRWSEELDEFDGKIMQCTYCFLNNQHAFLGNNRSAGFHSDWVLGPYNTQEDAQHALLNDAVSVIEKMVTVGSGPLKGMTHPIGATGISIGATAVPYAGSYGKYFNKGKDRPMVGGRSQKMFETEMHKNYKNMFDPKIQRTLCGITKDKGVPVFWDHNTQKWVNFVLKKEDMKGFFKNIVEENGFHGPQGVPGIPGRDADESALYDFMKKYVSEVTSAVSLSAVAEVKKLASQLKVFKTELSNAKAEREILHGRDEIFNDRAKVSEKTISKMLQDVVGSTIIDISNINQIICHNAKSTNKMIEAHKSLIDATKACFDETDKQFNQIYSEQDEAKIEAIKTREDLEWTSECFKQELISLLKESHQREDTFKVGDTVYQIDKNQLWIYDPNRKLWTTVKPSTQLVGDAKMKAELANIDKQAEQDIDKIYAAFHERQKKREETNARHKKEFTGEPAVTLTGPLTIDEGTTVTILASERVVKASLLKRAAKWTAYTVGIGSSAVAGVAAALYFFPLMF